jgi:hypothetical protein
VNEVEAKKTKNEKNWRGKTKKFIMLLLVAALGLVVVKMVSNYKKK